jgi:PAS domain S-box-containing protein
MHEKSVVWRYTGVLIALLALPALVLIYWGRAVPGAIYVLVLPTLIAAYRWGRRGGLPAALLFCGALLPVALANTWYRADVLYTALLLLLAGWLAGWVVDEQRQRRRLTRLSSHFGERMAVAVDAADVWRVALRELVATLEASGGALVWNTPEEEVWTSGALYLEEATWRDLATVPDLPTTFWRREGVLTSLGLRDALNVPLSVPPWTGELLLVRQRVPFARRDVQRVRFLLEVVRQAALGQIRYARADMVLNRQLQEARMLQQLNRLTGESLELDETLDSVLKTFANLIPYDIAEITNWNPDEEMLVRAAIMGRDQHVITYFEEGATEYAVGEGLSGWLALHREPLLVADLQRFKEARPMEEDAPQPLRSYLGLPLSVRGELVGTLEICGFTPGMFSERDLELAESVGSQAAIAIEKAQLYRTTRQRVRLLQRLSEVSQVAGRAENLEALFQEIVKQIANIMETEVAGLLLYAPQREALVARVPFHGIPEGWLANYAIPVNVDAHFNRIWREGTAFLVEDAQSDPIIERLGLLPLVMAMEVRQTLFVPLQTGGERLGLIQVSNTRDGRRFGDVDVRVLQMLSAQISGTIRISQLLERVQGRAEQVESLVSVASTIGSSLDLDEVLDSIVRAVTRVVGCQRTAIFTLDPSKSILSLVAALGVSTDYLERSQGVAVNEEGRAHAVAANEIVIVEDILSETKYSEVAPLADSEGFRSFVDIPLHRGEEPLGLLTVQFVEPHLFTQEELDLLRILAEQAAVAIENARLYEATDEELRLRVKSLEALQRITQEITTTLDLDRILQMVMEEAVRFGEGDTGLIIYWETPNQPRLRAVVGYEEGAQELKALEALLTEPDEHEALLSFLRPSVSLHIRDLSTLAAELQAAFPTGSLLVAPVFYQEMLTATILLHGEEREAFTSAMVEFLEGLAVQASIAVANAKRYEEQMRRGELMRQRAEQTRLFLEVSRTMRSDRPLESMLLDMAYATQEAVGYEIVIISVLDGESARRVAAAGLPLTEFERMKEIRQPWRRVAALFKPRFQLGQCYYIPAEHQDIWRGEIDVFEEQLQREPRTPGKWHAQDILVVPLRSTQGDILGYMSVDRPYDDRVPTRLSVEVLELFAAQIALAIENNQLVENLRLQLNTLSLFNELSRSITTKLDLSMVLNTVVQAVTNLLGYDYSTIYLQERESLRYVPRASSGYAVDILEDISYGPGEGLVGVVARTGMPLVLDDTENDPRYVPGPLSIGSSIMVPLTIEGRTGGVLVADRKEEGDFVPMEVATLTALADQISVAVENARLFEEVSRFSQEMEMRVEERTEELAEALQDLRQEQDRTQLLYRIASELVASLDIDRVLNKALSLLREAVDADRGSILLLDNSTGHLYYRAAIGSDYAVPPGGVRSTLSRNEGLIGWVLKNRDSVLIDRVREDERWVGREEDETRAMLAVPIVGTTGQPSGAIFLHAYTEAAFGANDRRLVEAAAVQLGNALNNAELYRLIREQTERLGTMLRAQQIEAVKSQAILEGIADGVMVADANGRITLFNVAAERILSVKRTQAIGRLLDEILGLYGSKAREWLLQVQKWHEEPESYESGEFLAERLDLERKVVSIHLSPVVSQSHEFLGTVSVFRDVTAEVEADRAKSEFVSTVSHELRTPMTSIKGYIDLMLMGTTGSLSEMQSNFLKVVKSNADRLTSLVNDLLDLSRIETGKIDLQPEALDMREIIEQAVLTITPKAKEKGLRVRAVMPPELPQVYADPDRVTQVLTNLVANAYKYTPVGGDIAVHAYVRDSMLHVGVSDTGIGISHADQEKIFERFFRVDDPLVQGESGTGLGLAIAVSLIKMQGGEMFVRSEPGEGSIFTFTMPLLEGEPTDPVGEVPEDFALPVAATILVVDDDREVADLLSLTLGKEGRRVLTASTGEEALHIARDQHPDLITLDIRLPDLDGLEVLQLLKRDPQTADIPVVIVSVVSDRQQGLDLGAIDYLTKPLDEEKLLEVVDRVLNGHELVLVADADLDSLSALREALRTKGLAVRTAVRGDLALRLAQALRPAVVVLDANLREKDGYEVLSQLRENEWLRDIPVIMTHAADEATEARASEVAQDDTNLRFLTKPFSVERLAAEITSLVNGTGGSKE